MVKQIAPIVNKFDLIRDWAKQKGILDKGDQKTQTVKLLEEAGEIAKAILKSDTAEIKDGIGDVVVVLTSLAYLSNLSIEDCISSAYEVIKSRQGLIVDGDFQKSAL
jgi:NTP pyrophosphatase (non-canonical NTP hydrolase)